MINQMEYYISELSDKAINLYLNNEVRAFVGCYPRDLTRPDSVTLKAICIIKPGI